MIKFVGGIRREYVYVNGKDNIVMTYNGVIEKDNFEVKESHKYFYDHNNIYIYIYGRYWRGCI